MAQFVKHFVQDLTQDIKIRQCGTIVFNADNESNVITVDLYNGQEPYSGGGTVAGAVICPDGATVALDNGTLTGNVASVTLKADCFAIPGQIGVGVQVISGSIRTTVLKAIYNVELLSTDNIVDPDSRITVSVTQLVADIEAATADIPASDMASLMAGIAPTFSATTAYPAGAYVYYNGTLYRFAVAHAAGSWTGTDVVQVALGNDVADLKRAVTNKMVKIESHNVFDPANIKESYCYNTYGIGADSTTLNCTNAIIPVTPSDVLRFYYQYNGATLAATHTWTAYDNTGTASHAKSETNSSTYTVPDGIYGVRVSYYKNSNLTPMITVNYEATDFEEYFAPYYVSTDEFLPDMHGTNVLDVSELLAEHSLTASGGVVENTAYATTGFIPVENSECLVATFDRGLTITLVRVVAYDDTKNVIASAGATSVDEYTVPAGVSFVRFCATNAYLTDPTARVGLNGVHEHYSPYVYGRADRIIDKNGLEISNILRYPYTTMRQDIVHNLAYKPLGVLSKGYVCVVSDDGNADVATYTIPMFIQKGVPCTLAMMQSSAVFGTTEGTNTVLSAINDHDFCVAQHGGLYWTTYYDEYTLSKFFDSEKTFWDSLGITPYGACSPGHQCNDMIRAMTGGRFGCHRAAYFDGVPWYGDTMYINGPRSNMYSLTSQNIIEGDLDYWKQKCDTTLSNKWLMMIHLHEAELTSEHKTKLEAVIDYALSIGLEFVTMEDIPKLI